MESPWPTSPLAELCDLIDYGYTASAQLEEVGPKFLRITDIVPAHLDWRSVPHCEISSKKLEKYLLYEGDIVIARTGATVGHAKRIRNPPKSVFASYLVRVRPKPEHSNGFIGLVVESADYKKFVLANAGGAAQPNANAKVLTRYPLPVPPRTVQDRIATVILAYDELIENNLRRIEILEEMTQAIYREWFVNFRIASQDGVKPIESRKGSIPAGWGITSLDDYAQSLIDGDWIETKDQGGNDFRLLQVSNIGLGAYRDTGNFRYITAETFARLKCTKINEGDILISRMPDPIGRAWLVDHLDEPAITAVDVAILTPPTHADGLYLSLWLNQPASLARVNALATGTTRKRIARSVLSKMEVIRPPSQLLERFATEVSPLRSLSTVLRNQTRNLRTTRDVLLPKLILGEVDVSDLDIDTSWLP